jgi:protein-L-isoaspartate O-methyltransferase
MSNYNYTATYSPDDNKLRLYAVGRLDDDTYKQVKAHGFKWAPKQSLFVAPMWTPSREDFLMDLAGEIDDEDKSLTERQEERAERFEDYEEKRAKDAERARKAVSAIADHIPLGQPILIGHHSERHARRDAQRIEHGMRKSIQLWDTSQYWKSRAAGALAHAKYKELPAVRARRIKGIEADQRKTTKSKQESEALLKFWSKDGLTVEQAIIFTGSTRAGWLPLPRKEGDRPDFNGQPSAYDALTKAHPSLYAPRSFEEVRAVALASYPRSIAHCERWLAHYANRLEYEKAMLDEQGAGHLLDKKPRPTQLPLCNYRQEVFSLPNRWNRGELIHYHQIDMTQAEYTAIYQDYKSTRIVGNSHRIRTYMKNHALVAVFLTDSKVHDRPADIEPTPIIPKTPAPHAPSVAPQPTIYDAMKDTLKAGVQTVTAPQLFPTPAPIAARMVELAEIEDGHRILEPSGGTGRILLAIQAAAPGAELVAVEIKAHLADVIRSAYRVPTFCQDFLECNGELGTFDRIVMNPPFQNAADITHILHARTMLKPGGRLVALCANGPRQQAQLQPLAEHWEALPAGSFAESGTGVNVALLTLRANDEANTL